MKDTIVVGRYYSRGETGSLYRPDLTWALLCKVLIYYGLESSSLYTHNTSWRSVHYMILNKPLVRLTTVHYQSAGSMISFTQVLTVQWSDIIPSWNVQFSIRIDLTLFCFNRIVTYGDEWLVVMWGECRTGGYLVLQIVTVEVSEGFLESVGRMNIFE